MFWSLRNAGWDYVSENLQFSEITLWKPLLPSINKYPVVSNLNSELQLKKRSLCGCSDTYIMALAGRQCQEPASQEQLTSLAIKSK